MHIEVIEDRFGGVIIVAETLPHSAESLAEQLHGFFASCQDKKLIWVTLPTTQAQLIAIFTAHGFTYYDCRPDEITLVRKNIPGATMPTASNHTVGVGVFVCEDDELLVIKDRIYKTYKLPGGYIDNNENLSQAVTREIAEETGVKVQLESVVSLAHFSPGQFNESNLYIVCKAKSLTRDIAIADTTEIIEARWINIRHYLALDEVSPLNKKLVSNAMNSTGIMVDDTFPRSFKQYEFFF